MYLYYRNFNANESCESLRTEKSLQVLYNAEPNFWIVIVILLLVFLTNFFNLDFFKIILVIGTLCLVDCVSTM